MANTAIYFYGDDPKDLSAAFWAANDVGTPVAQITGDAVQAANWIKSSELVIVVGGPAMSKVLDQLCADGLSTGTASGEFSMFCDTYSWYNTAAVGPINADGTNALNSLNLSWQQAQSAYSFINNHYTGGTLTTAQKDQEASSVSTSCGTVSNTGLA